MHGGKEEENPILIEELKGKRLFRRHAAWTEGEAYIYIYASSLYLYIYV